MSLLKTFMKEAQTRRTVSKPEKKYEPAHASLVSSNWNNIRKSVSKKHEEGDAPTDIVALDCEFVGTGPDGMTSSMARVSIVDYDGNVIVDKYVQPNDPVTDYRTKVTGIQAHHLKDAAWNEETCRAKVAEIIEGKIVVGHAVQHDFKALKLTHPHHRIRDTAIYRGFRDPQAMRKTPSLRGLTNKFLNRGIQDGVHNSVEDAVAALDLYKLRRTAWEKKMRAGKGNVQVIPEEDEEEDGEAVARADSAKRPREDTVEESSKKAKLGEPSVKLSPKEKKKLALAKKKEALEASLALVKAAQAKEAADHSAKLKAKAEKLKSKESEKESEKAAQEVAKPVKELTSKQRKKLLYKEKKAAMRKLQEAGEEPASESVPEPKSEDKVEEDAPVKKLTSKEKREARKAAKKDAIAAKQKQIEELRAELGCDESDDDGDESDQALIFETSEEVKLESLFKSTEQDDLRSLLKSLAESRDAFCFE